MKGEDFRILRLAKRLSQQDLSDKSGIHQTRISMIERGVAPRPDEEKRILRVLTKGAGK